MPIYKLISELPPFFTIFFYNLHKTKAPTNRSGLILPPKQGDRGGLILLPPGRLRGGLLFFRLEEPGFFLSEKESLIRDNGISCKTVWMLAYKQNYN